MPPISVMIKPASGSCNMRCRYCFYADEQENREVGSYGVMSLPTMRNLIDKALDYAEPACSFTFQGGEPTLAGLDYFREFVKYVGERMRELRTEKRPAPRIQIRYALQTNGYAITEEWARFFAENHFLIGVSLDGTKEIHDRYRLDAAGKGTYQRVMDSIALLEKHKVDFNILTVITGPSARRGQKIYSFFRQQHFDYHQYIECLDPLEESPGGHDYSLTPERLEQFLKSTFDAWYRDAAGGYYVSNRYFDNLLLMFYGREPESCNMRGVCGAQWTAAGPSWDLFRNPCVRRRNVRPAAGPPCAATAAAGTGGWVRGRTERIISVRRIRGSLNTRIQGWPSWSGVAWGDRDKFNLYIAPDTPSARIRPLSPCHPHLTERFPAWRCGACPLPTRSRQD